MLSNSATALWQLRQCGFVFPYDKLSANGDHDELVGLFFFSKRPGK
jgi:hypothetical protein